MDDWRAPLYKGIRHFEAGGKPYKPKWDYKLYTWGYGTPYKKGMELSPERAESDMRAHALSKEQQIIARFPELAKPENRNKLLALTDLTYNAGSTWFDAGLGKAVARGDWDDASKRFVQYNKAGGKTLPGLAKRRLWGVALMNDKVQDPGGFGGAATTVRAGGGGSYLDGGAVAQQPQTPVSEGGVGGSQQGASMDNLNKTGMLSIGVDRDKRYRDMMMNIAQNTPTRDVRHWLHGVSLPVAAIGEAFMDNRVRSKEQQQREALINALGPGIDPFTAQAVATGDKSAINSVVQQRVADRNYERTRRDALSDREAEFEREKELQKMKLAEAAKARAAKLADQKEIAAFKQSLKDKSEVDSGNYPKHPDRQSNAGVKITAGAIKQFREERGASENAMDTLTGFDPKFGGMGGGWETLAKYGLIFADRGWDEAAMISLGRNSKEAREAAQWWRKFRKYNELPERHELFGATLTKGEAEAWKSATISPEMDAKQIQAAIQQRVELLARAQARGINEKLALYGGGREYVNSSFRLGLSPKELASMSNDDIVKHWWGLNNKRNNLSLPYELYTKDEAELVAPAEKPPAMLDGGAPAAPAAPATAPAAPAAVVIPPELKTPGDFNIKEGQKVRAPDGKIYVNNGGKWELAQ